MTGADSDVVPGSVGHVIDTLELPSRPLTSASPLDAGVLAMAMVDRIAESARTGYGSAPFQNRWDGSRFDADLRPDFVAQAEQRSGFQTSIAEKFSSAYFRPPPRRRASRDGAKREGAVFPLVAITLGTASRPALR